MSNSIGLYRIVSALYSHRKTCLLNKEIRILLTNKVYLCSALVCTRRQIRWTTQLENYEWIKHF